MANKEFWNWSNNDLELDGDIASSSWWGDEVTPKEFAKQLNGKQGDISVWINSGGGECFAASMIYSMLKNYKGGKVHVKIGGIAASAASVIAMAGSTVSMSPTAIMMIHNPSTLAWGDSREMEKNKKVLDEIKESILNAYEIKTNLKRNHLAKLMDDETWMSAKKAVELGFADEILEDIKVSDKGAIGSFKNCLISNVTTEPEPNNTVNVSVKVSVKGKSIKSLRAGLMKIKKS